MAAIQVRSRRFPLSGLGQIVFETNAVHCDVKDMSMTGARLTPHGEVEVPDYFELTIRGVDEKHSCVVIWRDQNDIGVRFANAR